MSLRKRGHPRGPQSFAPSLVPTAKPLSKPVFDAYQQGRTEDRLFLADQAAFHLLPDSPICLLDKW